MARGGDAAPGSSSRGRGGKFKKYTRGGGHHFSRDLQPVDSEGNQVSMWSANAKNGDDDDDDDDSSEEESSSDDDAGPSAAAAEATREARKAHKKARKDAAIAKAKKANVQVGDLPSSDDDEDEDDDDMPANPNHSKAARKQAEAAMAPPAADEDGVDAVTEGVKKMKTPMSRREREAADAAAAKERYMKLHAAGKTDEAKSDMARLKLIREQRAAEAARRQAEKEEKDAQEDTRRKEIEAREAKRREAAAGPKKSKKK